MNQMPEPLDPEAIEDAVRIFLSYLSIDSNARLTIENKIARISLFITPGKSDQPFDQPFIEQWVQRCLNAVEVNPDWRPRRWRIDWGGSEWSIYSGSIVVKLLYRDKTGANA